MWTYSSGSLKDHNAYFKGHCPWDNIVYDIFLSSWVHAMLSFTSRARCAGDLPRPSVSSVKCSSIETTDPERRSQSHNLIANLADSLVSRPQLQMHTYRHAQVPMHAHAHAVPLMTGPNSESFHSLHLISSHWNQPFTPDLNPIPNDAG